MTQEERNPKKSKTKLRKLITMKEERKEIAFFKQNKFSFSLLSRPNTPSPLLDKSSISNFHPHNFPPRVTTLF